MSERTMRIWLGAACLAASGACGCSAAGSMEAAHAWTSCTLDGRGTLDVSGGSADCSLATEDRGEGVVHLRVFGDPSRRSDMFEGEHAIGPASDVPAYVNDLWTVHGGVELHATSGTIDIEHRGASEDLITWSVVLADGDRLVGSALVANCGDVGDIC